jgi:hypothetical protein
MAVIANANQQPAAIGIGKCRYRLGQLLCIRHPVLEVLLLVFALANEALKVAPVIHFMCKGTNYFSTAKKISIFLASTKNIIYICSRNLNSITKKQKK